MQLVENRTLLPVYYFINRGFCSHDELNRSGMIWVTGELYYILGLPLRTYMPTDCSTCTISECVGGKKGAP